MKNRQKYCLAQFSFLRFKRSFFYSLMLRSLVACVTTLAVARAHGQPAPAPAPPPDTLDYNAPWPGDKAQDREDNYRHAMESAHSALDRNDYPKAMSDANRALKFKPHDPAATALKKDIENRRGDGLAQAERERSYRRAMLTAHTAFDRGEYDKALDNANRALQIKPNDPDAQELKGYVERRRNQPVAPPTTVVITPETPPSTTVITPPPSTSTTVLLPPPGAQPSTEAAATAPAPSSMPNLKASKPARNQISISGDFMLGQGNVTLPFGYSLRSLSQNHNINNLPVGVFSPSRNSDYFGGTLSYSFGQQWFLDASYARGSSTGQFALVTTGGQSPFGNGGQSTFKITDDWYQAYIRYAFPGLAGTHLSAYMRAGATYITITQSDISQFPNEYEQSNKANDIRGNLGFGALYLWHPTSRIRLGVQLEGEGFYGNRNQKSQESVPINNEFGPTVSINNSLYGGIGRGTVRFEYALGHSRLMRIFADGGMEATYTELSYPGAGTANELLWGPYIKAGLRYSF
jgi:tetratricopeptide (TPR) repeat protein